MLLPNECLLSPPICSIDSAISKASCRAWKGTSIRYSADSTRATARGEMEVDPSFKQLIPYVIFCHRDGGGKLSVFRYTRGSGQGEQRLHRKHSVGIGGHISSDDAASTTPYAEGMRRELQEEVLVNTPICGPVRRVDQRR